MMKIDGLHKQFGRQCVLKNCTLEIDDGEVILILGENGSGKSTLINCILRLLKPDQGSILLDGQSIYSISNKRYFSEVSAVLESSENVYDYLTGMENIEYFTALGKRKICREELEEMASRFYLTKHLSKKVGDYSRGMRQKLSIIIALLLHPRILILDEPDLGLDFKSKNALGALINDWSRKHQMSILIASHQTDFIEKLDAQMYLLKDGTLQKISKEDREYEADLYKVEFADGTSQKLTWSELHSLYCDDHGIVSITKLMGIEDIIQGNVRKEMRGESHESV